MSDVGEGVLERRRERREIKFIELDVRIGTDLMYKSALTASSIGCYWFSLLKHNLSIPEDLECW